MEGGEAKVTDHELLSRMLELPQVLRLSKREQKGFVQMFSLSSLTEKQRSWVRRVAERLGLTKVCSERQR